MARYRRKSSSVLPIWFHLATLLGFLLIGGGLLLEAWGLVVKEQEAQRALLANLYLRTVVSRNVSSSDDEVYRQFGRTPQVAWEYVGTGLMAFVVGGYLLLIGAGEMYRPRPGVQPAGSPPSYPDWIEHPEESGDTAQPDAAATGPPA